MTGKNAVLVGGVGARTAAGETAPASCAAVRAGIACMAEHPTMIDRYGDPMLVARAPYLAPSLSSMERLIALGVPAVREALEPFTKGAAARKLELPMFVALPPARPGRDAALDAALGDRFKTELADVALVTGFKAIPTGHAGGLRALEEGWKLVSSGASEICLAGGVDSYLERETLEWLDRQDQLHSANCTWGFCPGEAAGFVVLVSEKVARAHSLDPALRILGAATSREENRIKTDTVCIGKGLTEAVQTVLAALAGERERIHGTYCDMNGEPYRAEEFGFMLARTSERFVDPAGYTAPADCWGDLGAASGPLFTALAAAAAMKGYARGPHSLLWASSEGGERGAVLVSALGVAE